MSLHNPEDFICSVCSGKMLMIRRLTTSKGRQIRLKCSCGHTEDIPDQSGQPSLDDFELNNLDNS